MKRQSGRISFLITSLSAHRPSFLRVTSIPDSTFFCWGTHLTQRVRSMSTIRTNPSLRAAQNLRTYQEFPTSDSSSLLHARNVCTRPLLSPRHIFATINSTSLSTSSDLTPNSPHGDFNSVERFSSVVFSGRVGDFAPTRASRSCRFLYRNRK